MLRAWEERPDEIKSLFNPPFCAALLYVAVKEYRSQCAAGMPLITAHLLLPLALHAETRSVFPKTTATSLTSWIGSQPEIRLGLAERIVAFRDLTNEALRFGFTASALRLDDDGTFGHIPRKLKGLAGFTTETEEIQDCFKVVRDLGRWFARAPDATFLFRLLRLHP